MLDFYEKHYSANLMRLVVYGATTLDQLEQWVVQKFSAVPNKNLTRFSTPTDPFHPEQLAKIVNIVPVKDAKNIEVIFPMPATEDLYLTKPTKYFGHLIGHESGGSILSALKAKRWANGLSAYTDLSTRDYACYVVKVDLTTEGVHHVEEIVTAIFAYIGMIQRAGPQDWVWKELKHIAEMTFRFLDRLPPEDYVERLATAMQIYAPAHTLCGDHLLFEEDLKQTMHFLSFLRPDNALILVSHKGLQGQTDRVEKWYGTNYSVHNVPADQLKQWQKTMLGGSEWDHVLHFPEPNPFIPEDFSLKQKNGEEVVRYPKLVQEERCKGPGPLPLAPVVPMKPHHKPASDLPEDADDESDEEDDDDAMEEEDGEDDSDEGDDDNDDDGDHEEGGEGKGAESSTNNIDHLIAHPDWLPIVPATANLVWHKDDSEHRWDMPKSRVIVYLESMLTANLSAWHIAMAELYAEGLTEVLSEYSYYADCAGFTFSVSPSRGGLSLSVLGYSDKLSALLERAFHQAYSIAHPPATAASEQPPMTEALFHRIKEKVLRNYKNTLFAQPYHHCMLANFVCLEQPRWTAFEKYSALKEISLPGFQAFAQDFLRYLKIEVLVVGNSTSEEAKSLEKMVRETLHCLPLPVSMDTQCRVVDLFSTSHGETSNSSVTEYVYRLSALSHNPAEVNSAVEVIYLVGAGAGRNATQEEVVVRETLLHLLEHMISEPAFDVLRTKEQLGYMVWATIKRLALNMLGLAFVVQSSHKDPIYLDGRIEAFLESYRAELASMSPETVQTFIQSAIDKLLEKPKNLNNEAGEYKEEIVNKTYLFNHKDYLVEKLRDPSVINHQSILAFFDDYVRAGSTKRHKFSSQFFGKHYSIPAKEEVEGETVASNGLKRKLLYRKLRSLETYLLAHTNTIVIKDQEQRRKSEEQTGATTTSWAAGGNQNWIRMVEQAGKGSCVFFARCPS
eukprot:scaffold2602_cov177-Ochromonas_danica.AAC.13